MIRGNGTKFSSQLMVGGTIRTIEKKNFVVAAIESDESAIIKVAPEETHKCLKYKCIPKLDQAAGE